MKKKKEKATESTFKNTSQLPNVILLSFLANVAKEILKLICQKFYERNNSRKLRKSEKLIKSN